MTERNGRGETGGKGMKGRDGRGRGETEGEENVGEENVGEENEGEENEGEETGGGNWREETEGELWPATYQREMFKDSCCFIQPTAAISPYSSCGQPKHSRPIMRSSADSPLFCRVYAQWFDLSRSCFTFTHLRNTLAEWVSQGTTYCHRQVLAQPLPSPRHLRNSLLDRDGI